MKTTAQINKILAEGKERIAVEERITCPVRKLGPAAESMDGGGDDGGMYEAKIWHADRINSNGRVYSRELMQRNIDRLRPKFAEGGVCGSVDHGTGLAQQAIIWRDMRMEADGAAYGKFEIVPTSVGKDLEVQCRGGMSIGMSTYGWGSGRQPTDAERIKYNLPPASDDDFDDDGNYFGPVVMGDDYELSKVDAVDIPSVTDARIVQKQSRDGNVSNPVAEGREVDAVAEAHTASCSSGLHWIRRGTCGHILSECTCESDDKHTVWTDRQCDKCGGVQDGMTVDQFKKTIAETKGPRKAISEANQEPLPQTYFKYVKGKGGNSFEPISDVETAKELTSNAFEIIPTWGGVRFVRKPVQTDELYHFEGSPMEAVLKEIDDFWKAKPEYEKYGVMFHRGIMMHGAPGTGKTSAVNQAVEMVTRNGDIVFYGRSVGTLKEALGAFREVEPDRKVVVILEDADEYVGYQEREMLNLLDGADTVQGVLYLATTNYLNRFPERLLRPGRFDKRVHIGPPNLAGRKAYLQNKLGKVETAEEIERLATETDGLSFGHLRELIAAIYILKEPKPEVLARLKGTSRGRSSEGSSRLSDRVGEQPASESKVEPILTTVPSKAAQESSDMEIKEQVNQFVKGLAAAEGIELPTREVLPAEIAAQLEAKDKEITALKEGVAKVQADHKAEIEKVLADKAELQKQLDVIAAEKAESKRLADVLAKAGELLKDSAFADSVLDDVKDAAAADKSFDATKVESLVKAREARYEKAAAKVTKALPEGFHGRRLTDDDITDEDLNADVEGSAKSESSDIEPAVELSFAAKRK